MVSIFVPLSPVLGRPKPRVLTTRSGASALAEPLSVSMVTALPSTVALAVSRRCSRCFWGMFFKSPVSWIIVAYRGVVLDQAQHIGGVNVANFSGFRLGNHHLNVILQQRVAIVRAHFGNGVGIVLQTFHDDLAILAAGGDRE